MTHLMGNVLILNGNGVASGSHHCGSLITLLHRAHDIDRIQETSIECPLTNINLIPDLILLRCSLQNWVEQVMQCSKKTWASAKTFAVLCDREVQQEEKIRSALIDVDDFLFCPYQEHEFLLRIKRLLKNKRQTVSFLLNRAIEHSPKRDFLVGESETFLRAVRKVG